MPTIEPLPPLHGATASFLSHHSGASATLALRFTFVHCDKSVCLDKLVLGQTTIPLPFGGYALISYQADGAIISLDIKPHLPEGNPPLNDALSLQEKYRELLYAYFGLEASTPQPTTNFVLYSPSLYRLNVWRSLLAIPYGAVCSYKDVARLLGQKAGYQSIGSAISHNPISIFVPCHRVIANDNSIGGYAHGIDCKQAILEIEHR